jgi:hypothetical protein
LQLSGIGRRLSSAEVMRQATASYSRLVREEAVREFPVTEHEVSAMAAKDSRPVREEAVESSDDYGLEMRAIPEVATGHASLLLDLPRTTTGSLEETTETLE